MKINKNDTVELELTIEDLAIIYRYLNPSENTIKKINKVLKGEGEGLYPVDSYDTWSKIDSAIENHLDTIGTETDNAIENILGEVEELTLEEVCKELGREIKIIK